MRLSCVRALVCLVGSLGVASACLGQTPESAVVMKVTGDVKVERADGPSVAAVPEMVLKAGDTLRTGPAGAATLKLGEGNVIALQENARMQIGASAQPAPSLTLLSGSLLGRLKNVPKGGKVSIGTSTSMAGIEGTTFSVSAAPEGGASSVAVAEGVVVVESRDEPNKSVVVGAQKTTRVSEWGKTTITATGSGVPSTQYRPIPVVRDNVEIKVVSARGAGKTREEAVKAARETLSGRILRAKIGPDMTVSDWLVGKDAAYARLAAFVAASAVMPAGVQPDGTFEVAAEANIGDLDRVWSKRCRSLRAPW